MSNDLIAPDDLSGFPGAPFADGVVDAAVAELRKAAGWHIAPVVDETVALEVEGRSVILPTLRLSAVTAVRDVTSLTDAPTAVTDYRTAETLRFRAGIVDRPGGWPCGVLEFDISHGYDRCPPDLLPALAALAREARGSGVGGSVRLGSLSVNLPDSTETVGDVVSRYTIPSRP